MNVILNKQFGLPILVHGYISAKQVFSGENIFSIYYKKLFISLIEMIFKIGHSIFTDIFNVTLLENCWL